MMEDVGKEMSKLSRSVTSMNDEELVNEVLKDQDVQAFYKQTESV